jgi:hypothetical protein
MYPVAFESDFAPARNRLTTFFRWFLAIPHFILGYFYAIGAMVAVFVAWFAILFTGQYPEPLYGFVAGFVRFYTRLMGYITLLTDEYPPFDGGEHPEYPVRVTFAGPLPEYNRLKTGLRIIFAIPLMVLRYVMAILIEAVAFGSWVLILVTGQQQKGLQELLVLGESYTARSDAYLFLLTETYPPFSEDMKAALDTPESGGTSTTAVGTDAAAVAAPVAPPAVEGL